ncbi:uncharacterized protein [Engystomops pustulosus]|uniref:uncharacterized protein isoform X2 n=2 Tax=Engystomops pustulosus TaxID=76066 RepID=UPI003AFB53FC
MSSLIYSQRLTLLRRSGMAFLASTLSKEQTGGRSGDLGATYTNWFCGVLGHTFMESLKGSGDYCQAQHDLYADK